MLFTCCFFCQRLTLIVCGFDACGCYLSNSTHLILASCNGNRFATSVFELNRNVCLYVQDLNHFVWHWNLNFQCSLSPTKLSLWAFFKKQKWIFSLYLVIVFGSWAWNKEMKGHQMWPHPDLHYIFQIFTKCAE